MEDGKLNKGIIIVIIIPIIVVVVVLGVLRIAMLHSEEQKTDEDEIVSTEALDVPVSEETVVPIQEETEAEQPAYAELLRNFNVKEISRDGNYKTMEMCTYDYNFDLTKIIVFELPVEWEGESTVFTATPEPYSMKVDMWDVVSATRESVLEEYKEAEEYIEENDDNEMITENIYFSENYEVFYRKYTNFWENFCYVHSYLLYANEERFSLTGYVFIEDLPEYDLIFKRIAESVVFQF